MRTKVLGAIGLAGLAVALAVSAALPTFTTFSANGLAAAPAYVKIPADPNSQIRIVSIFAQSDTNVAQLQFMTGNGAYYQTATNLTSSTVTNLVNSTNGLIVNSLMILQHAGTLYTNVLSSVNQSTNTGLVAGTNIVLATGGWGVIPSPGDEIFQVTATNGWYIGNVTNQLAGEAIYVGNYGRPVLVKSTSALVTNYLQVTVHYDSQSQ